MPYKEIFALVAIGITLFAYFPYIRSILLGVIVPHLFSWIIWSLVTVSVFVAQLVEGGGAGAWPIAVTSSITIFVAFVAYFKTEKVYIKKMDWFFLILAFSAIPIWFFTANALWAVVILTTVDALGYFTTIRKSFVRPREESALFFFLFSIRNGLIVLALETYTLTTVLYPAVSGLFCFIVMVVVVTRRWMLRNVYPSYQINRQ